MSQCFLKYYQYILKHILAEFLRNFSDILIIVSVTWAVVLKPNFYIRYLLATMQDKQKKLELHPNQAVT